MSPAKHDEVEPAGAATCCILAVLLLAFLLPHLMAYVHGSTAVSESSQADIHIPLLTPPALTTSRLPKCDRMFISNDDGPKNGTFVAPNMSIPKGHSRQCIYTFIAAENERVHVTFIAFNLKGALPECTREYVDLYTEIEDPGMELITTPFGGRYCGRNRPRNRISLYQTLVINFYTDYDTVTSDAFHGLYEFINISQYEVGTPTPESVCSFDIFSDKKREGAFRSPTYPGVYPKNLQCQYRFLGKKTQRVRLEFMDFDLVFGGAHCPFDFVKVYDGDSPNDPLIGTYCGQQRNLVIYSSSENMYVQFTTLQRTADSENRGFSGFYEFSERFVNLDFIGKNDSEHIRGTECDQKILSKKESSGQVFSPNYPFPYHHNTVCKYYIYGLQDNQNLERVRLVFNKFEIPSKDPDCSDGGFLKIYIQGQEERQALDEFDHSLCGVDVPDNIVSEGARLAMVFSSGPSQGPGFKANYTFETDYKVPGTPSPGGGCHFTYHSSSQQTGEFNSPRYPANYPSNTTCEYHFLGKPGEQVKIVFNFFKTKTRPDPLPVVGYNEVCQDDWLELFEVHPSGRESKIGRYCSKTAPGPIVSSSGVHSMKVVLRTDEEGVASGFIATFTFIPTTKFGAECGYNISAQTNGVITTPNFPQKYENKRQVCHWYISVRPEYKILLFFEMFSLEGDPIERGCGGAVVRVWRDLSEPPVEMCGPTVRNGSTEILSATSVLKVTFSTAEKAIGADGFRAVWTEVKEADECDQYRCAESSYCVAEDVRCNEQPNCGAFDQSDEEGCAKTEQVNVFVIVGAAVGVATFIVLLICLICHRKRKRRRRHYPDHPAFHHHHHHHHHDHSPPPFEPRQKGPREIPSMQFLSVDSV